MHINRHTENTSSKYTKQSPIVLSAWTLTKAREEGTQGGGMQPYTIVQFGVIVRERERFLASTREYRNRTRVKRSPEFENLGHI